MSTLSEELLTLAKHMRTVAALDWAMGDDVTAKAGNAAVDAITRAATRLSALEAAVKAAVAFAEGQAVLHAVNAGLGVSEWEAFVPPWFKQARAAIEAQAEQ